MAHPYRPEHADACARCGKERARRAAQAAADPFNRPRVRRASRRRSGHASRAEQAARYLDAGPLAWDDSE